MSSTSPATAVTTRHAAYYWVEGNVDSAPSSCPLSDREQTTLLDYTRSLLLARSGLRDANRERLFDQLPAFPVHLSFRVDGAYGGEGIGIGNSLDENIRTAVDGAIRFRSIVIEGKNPATRASVSESPHGNASPFPPRLARRLGIELTLFARPSRLRRRDMDALRVDIELGIHGLALQHGGRVTLFSNSKPLIHNYRLHRLLERLSESLGAPPDAYCDPRYDLVRLDTIHLVQPSPHDVCLRCFRGDRLVSVEEITRPTIEAHVYRLPDLRGGAQRRRDGVMRSRSEGKRSPVAPRWCRSA